MENRTMLQIRIVATTAACLAFLAGSAAHADTVELQNTAADQSVVDDGLMATNIDDMRNFGAGGNDGANRDDLGFYAGLGNGFRGSVLRFNNIAGALPAAVVADPSLISRVTLSLYQESVGYSGAAQPDNVSFYRVLKTWDEGTMVYGNVGGSVDGVSSRTRHPGVLDPTGWQRTAGTSYVWELSVAETVHEVGYKTNNQWGRFAEQASIANVDADTKRWFYDSGTQTLYVNKNNDAVDPPDLSSQGVCYYLAEDVWEGRNASGDTDVDKTSPIDLPIDYHEWQTFGHYSSDPHPELNDNKWVHVISDRGDDPTEARLLDWVRGWVDGSYDNYGVACAKGLSGNEWNNRRFTPSDAHGGVADYSYGPKLTIEYVIPEPATLGLLALGALAALRRRKR